MSEYQEGQTATHKDGRSIVFRNGQWVSNSGSARTALRAKTTAQDMKALTEASSRAEAEADAQRDYDSLSSAVRTFDTGPVRGALFDAFAPNDGGAWDTVGTLIGALPMAGVPTETKVARDRLKTASASNAIASSAQMKGAASDRDMALLRTSGISTGKHVQENQRILTKAQMDSKRSQARALLTNKWISKFGSLAQASPNGMTFEQAVNYANRDLENQTRKSSLPKPPPSAVRRQATSTGRKVYDINGAPVQ